MLDLFEKTAKGPVALSLGSNLGNRMALLGMARAALGGHGLLRILKTSSLYETEPVECGPQRWFLNQVVWAETDLPPAMLLSFCQRIETFLGRTRNERHGPRTIDVDILLMGGLVIETPALCLPHPALPRRRSLLVPLVELGLPWVHPVLGRDIPALFAACRNESRVGVFRP